MAEHTTIQFEDVSLEEARRMGWGPRMEPMLYQTLRKKIEALSTEAARVRLGPEITPARMKSYILRLARNLAIPVTVRRVSGGVIFWRSTSEDLQQAQETASRLQTARRERKRGRAGRRRSAPARAGGSS
jgi:hypothetical protein